MKFKFEESEVENICLKFYRQLNSAGRFAETLQQFQSIEGSNEKIMFAEKIFKKHNVLNYAEWKEKKDPAKSDLGRNEGNTFYRQKKFMDALEGYNKSLCFAPPGSVTAGLAYANRSAAYLAMGYYEKALENIELARNHQYPKDQLVKLKDREEKCLKLMNNKPSEDRFKENKDIFDEIVELKIHGNKRAPYYIADCLEMKTSSDFGRYIVTNKDLEVGTVIAIEEPFIKRMFNSSRFERCLNCFRKNFLHLIPCDFCCAAMFCSEECKKSAWDRFHQFECEVSGVLLKIHDNWLAVIRIFLESLHIFNGDPLALNDFLKSVENSKATIYDFDFSKMSEAEKQKAMLQVIQGLETHQEKREPRTLYCVCNNMAILSDLFLNHTKLGSILNDKNSQAMFRKFILKQTMINIMHYRCLKTSVSESEKEENPESLESDFTGLGCYLFNTLLNHSCAPNVERVSFRCKNYFFVSRPIKSGEQIFDCYYGQNHFEREFKERQKDLQNVYFFTCRCIACQSPSKFPLQSKLGSRDPNFDAMLLPQFDLNHIKENLKLAKRTFEKRCRYIQQHDREYPTFELWVAKILAFDDCLKIFYLSDEY